MKGFAATIGYDTYLIQPGDIGPLFEIASRSVKIEQAHWQEPCYPAADSKPFVTEVKSIDFEQERQADGTELMPKPEQPKEPDGADLIF